MNLIEIEMSAPRYGALTMRDYEPCSKPPDPLESVTPKR